MTFAQQVLDFLVAQLPAVLVLVYAYMNGKVIRANNNAQILKLQADIAAAHKKIDAQFPASASDVDVITDIVSPSNPPKS